MHIEYLIDRIGNAITVAALCAVLWPVGLLCAAYDKMFLKREPRPGA